MGSISEDLTRQGKKAIYGYLSLFVFGVAIAICAFFLLTASSSGYVGDEGFGYVILGFILSCSACIVSVCIALVGLWRRERPRWPAITGLALSGLPALAGINFFFTCHW